MLQYTLLSTNRGQSLTLFVCGEFLTMTDEHPHFAKVVHELTACNDPSTLDETRIKRLAQLGTMESISEMLNSHSQRVSWDEATEQILFNGQPVHSTLATHIAENIKHGDDYWKALVRFMEKLDQNPSYQSQARLYDWINASGLTLLDDGRFVGYKVVDHQLRSWHAGRAMVNGSWIEGHIPNVAGTTISMPRKMVDDERENQCSYGLHVGNKDYMHSFQRNFTDPRILTVAVDPKRVVTVPPDHNCAKLRVSAYTVLRADTPGTVCYYDTALTSAADIIARRAETEDWDSEDWEDDEDED